MRKTAMFFLAALMIPSFLACQKKDRKEVEELNKTLARRTNDLHECNKRSGELEERVMRLENAINKIKEDPCAFEMDPISLEVKPIQESTERTGSKTPVKAKPASGPPLNREQVAVRVRSATGIMRRCYEEAAMRDKELASSSRSVTLTFTLLNSGRVGRIKLTPFVGSGFDKCVKNEVRSWKFDPFGGFPQDFQQRLHLKPKG